VAALSGTNILDVQGEAPFATETGKRQKAGDKKVLVSGMVNDSGAVGRLADSRFTRNQHDLGSSVLTIKVGGMVSDRLRCHVISFPIRGARSFPQRACDADVEPAPPVS
jgi:hypothetical protein